MNDLRDGSRRRAPRMDVTNTGLVVREDEGSKRVQRGKGRVMSITSSDLRAHHRHLLLTLLRELGRLSRVEISEITGMSGCTVSNLTAQLMAAGTIEETPVSTVFPEGPARVGRPRRHLQLSETNLLLGVHLTAGHARITLASILGRVVQERSISFRDASSQEALGRIETRLRAITNSLDINKVLAAAVTSDCLDTRSNGGIDIKSEVHDALRRLVVCPVAVSSSALGHALAIATTVWVKDRNSPIEPQQRFQRAPDSTLLHVHVGESLEAVVVIDQIPYAGANGAAGRLNNMPAIRPGRRCLDCPPTGRSLSHVAGNRHVSNLLIEHGAFEHNDYEAIIRDPTNMPATCQRYFQRAIEAQANSILLALPSLIDLLDPDLLSFSGLPFENTSFCTKIEKGLQTLVPAMPDLRVSNMQNPSIALAQPFYFSRALLTQTSRVLDEPLSRTRFRTDVR